MAKFILNQRGGQAKISELAAATAQRANTIRLGLEWLAAGGHIFIQRDGTEDMVSLSAGNGELNRYAQRELYIAIKGILDETAAYRAHFARADVQSLVQEQS
jgi:hypothetical protein